MEKGEERIALAVELFKSGYNCSYTAGSTCTESVNASYIISENIPVSAGEMYEITKIDGDDILKQSSFRIIYLDANNIVVSSTQHENGSVSSSYSFTVPNGVSYIKFRSYDGEPIRSEFALWKLTKIGGTADNSNLFNVDDATINTRFTSSSTDTQNGAYITGYIDAVPGDVIYVKPAFHHDASVAINKVNCYDSTSDTKIGARVLTTAENSSNTIFTITDGVGSFTVPDVNGTTRIKIALKYNSTGDAITKADLANVVITKNEPIS